jgi:hypothetical protein
MSTLSPEREEELIEKFVRLVVDSNMESIAIFYLKGFTPLFRMGSQLARIFALPYLSIFPGFDTLGEDIIDVLGKRDNIDRIIRRLHLFSEEREREKRIKKANEEKPSYERGVLQKIRDSIEKFFN